MNFSFDIFSSEAECINLSLQGIHLEMIHRIYVTDNRSLSASIVVFYRSLIVTEPYRIIGLIVFLFPYKPMSFTFQPLFHYCFHTVASFRLQDVAIWL